MYHTMLNTNAWCGVKNRKMSYCCGSNYFWCSLKNITWKVLVYKEWNYSLIAGLTNYAKKSYIF